MESDSSPIVGSTVSASFNGQWAASISQTTPYLFTTYTHTHTHTHTHRCCYKTVHFATAASQNGLHRFSLHKKTNIIKKKTRKHQLFYFFHLLSKSSGETISLHGTFVKISRHCFAMQPQANPPLCSGAQTYSRILKSSVPYPDSDPD